MKTNHQRGFVARRFTYRGYYTFWGKAEPLDGSIINAWATVASGRHQYVRRDRAGAKKFLHSRRRRHDRDTIRLMLRGSYV
jgi:hypothetical protein